MQGILIIFWEKNNNNMLLNYQDFLEWFIDTDEITHFVSHEDRLELLCGAHVLSFAFPISKRKMRTAIGLLKDGYKKEDYL